MDNVPNMFIRKLASIRKFLSQKDCETLVHSFISSRLDSCNALLFGISRANISKLQKVQNAAVRLILCKKRRESVGESGALRSGVWFRANNLMIMMTQHNFCLLFD